MPCVCASIASVILGAVCLAASVGMIVQFLFFDNPLYYYDEFYFKELLISPQYMMVWCLVQGALGIATSLISIVFAFIFSSCGLPTAIVFDILSLLSSVGMAGFISYETLAFKVNQDDQWTIPLTNIGVPFLFAFLFIFLTFASCCTRRSLLKNKKFFDL